MNFVQKVYYNDKPLILTVDKAEYIKYDRNAADYVYYSLSEEDVFGKAAHGIEDTLASGAIIQGASVNELIDKLTHSFRIIDAGGGLAFNEKGELLMIFRRGKWDLPKGKLDEGETIEECAVREVNEETGLAPIKLGEQIGHTYHIYQQGKETLLKRSAWFRMYSTSDAKLKPQKAENILEARWVGPDELGILALKSYAAIQDIMIKAGLKW